MSDGVILFTSFLGVVAVFAALWPISLLRRDASTVDIAWGPSYAIILWGVWIAAGQPEGERMLAILALTSAWTLRLGWLMIGRKLRDPHEDPRYTAMRDNWDPGYWWKSLFMVFLLQGAVQWVLSLPGQMVALSEPVALAPWEWVFVGVAIVGLAIETVADAQLEKFRRENPRDALCQTGLWAWSRHPNYFGELVFWWAIWALAAPAAGLWTVIGPLLLTFLIRYVSGVPILEKYLSSSKRGFDTYRQRTPTLTPRRPNGAQSTQIESGGAS